MADKKITVQVDVETNADEAGGKVKNLKVQLREARIAFEQLQNSTKATAADLKKAADRIDDISDKIDKAKFSSGQFEDKIASLPGPLGKLGGGLKSVKDAFTTFGTSLTISLGIIGLLATAFFTIKNALGKTEEGTKALSAVTSAFNKILAPILAIFEKLGLAILPIVTKGFEAVGSVMGKVAKFFGVSTAKIDETTASLEKGNEAANTLAEAEKKRLEEVDKKKKEAEDKQKTRDEEAKKRREDKLAKDKEANAVEIEAFKATLTEREKAEYEAGITLAEQKAKLEAAGRKDFTAIEEQYRITLAEITKKYNDEEAKKKEEKDKKDKDDLLKKQEEERGIILSGLQTKFEDLDRENARIEGDFVQDLERLKQQRDILAEQEATELQNTELTEFQKTEIRKKYADARKGITDQEIETEKAAAQAKQEINMAYLQLFEQFGNVLGQLAGKNKALAIAGIVISQAASIGQIIAQTGIANAKAVAANPLAFGQPWVTINTISAGLSIASTIAGAVKSIQQINSAASQAGVKGGGGGSANTSAPTLPKVGGTSAPQIQIGAGMNPTQQIGETIANARSPIKAYVVSQEISSQQALDRRTNVAATFG